MALLLETPQAAGNMTRSDSNQFFLFCSTYWFSQHRLPPSRSLKTSSPFGEMPLNLAPRLRKSARCTQT